MRTYKGDRKQALKEHVWLDYLYALSDQRENLVEWYPFRGDGCLLEAGSGYGALTGVYSRKVAHVDVLDESEENLEVNRPAPCGVRRAGEYPLCEGEYPRAERGRPQV